MELRLDAMELRLDAINARIIALVDDVTVLNTSLKGLQNEPEFLGFGAFETTAFISAVLVTLYTFIPDPTGRQDALDVSEYRVYIGWRWGVVVVLLDVILVLAALATQVVSSQSSETVAWVVFLMLAPWAPLADKVGRNMRPRSWSTVCRMMRSRVSRNEAVGVLREYLHTGHRNLYTSQVTRYLDIPDGGRHALIVNEALQSQGKNQFTSSKWAQALAKHLMSHPYAKGDLKAGVVLSERRLDRLLVRLQWWDPLAWWWTRESATRICLRVTPFTLHAVDTKASRQSPFLDRWTRAKVLDVIDMHTVSGTVCHDRLARMRSLGLCELCCMALRVAVESFLESSDRQHADLRAGAWFRHARLTVSGRMNDVVSAMCESVFRDHPGSLEAPADTPLSNKDVSRYVLLFYFLLARCLAGHCEALAGVSERVEQRFHTEAWWKDFWQAYERELQAAVLPMDEGDELSGPDWDKCDAMITRVMHQLVDGEVKALLKLLAKDLPDLDDEVDERDPRLYSRICGDELCWLSRGSCIGVTLSDEMA